ADDWLKLGGSAFSKIGKAKHVSVVLALPDTDVSGENAADFALGILLRAYTFDKYKTKKGRNDESRDDKSSAKITLLVADPQAAKKAFA
ncbi:M17 family peptidase N-terminal domain-containing protein, partial [Klebsiella pneumoniae]|uniref:M17 family peptidase N-terminal domain-containing protein n=3 Tax=Pseudomonadota TaxID=1224 RepID=UPI001953F1C9